MKKTLLAAAAVFALSTGTAFADECVFEGTIPVMPDPATATTEDRQAALNGVRDLQASLTPYRECLNARIDNTELPREARQGALDAFNETVDTETAVVEAWNEFEEAWQSRNN